LIEAIEELKNLQRSLIPLFLFGRANGESRFFKRLKAMS
jgi:hypothetical protein